MTDSSKIRNM